MCAIWFVAGLTVGMRCGKPKLPHIATQAVAWWSNTGGAPVARIAPVQDDGTLRRPIEKLRAENLGLNRNPLSVEHDAEIKAVAHVDTVTQWHFDTLPGILQIDKTPGGVNILSYKVGKGNFMLSSERCSRERYSIYSSGPNGKPRVKSNWPVADFGATAWLTVKSAADSFAPNATVGCGLVVKRYPVTFTLGPEFDGRLKLAARVSAGWWF